MKKAQKTAAPRFVKTTIRQPSEKPTIRQLSEKATIRQFKYNTLP